MNVYALQMMIAKILSAGCIFMLLAGCNGETAQDEHRDFVNAMDHFPDFDLQGHRGARGLLPENTIPSLLKALEYQVTTLEFDLVVSADSKLVISHEPWFHHHISTKPDGEPVTMEEARSLNMFKMTYEEIRQFDVGKRGHVNFPEQEPMPAVKPLMRDAILAVEAYVQEQGLDPVFYNIETKSVAEEYDEFYPRPETFSRLLFEELKDLDVLDRVFIQSFDVNTLIAMKEIAPELPLVLLVQNREGLDWNLEHLGFTPDIYSPNFRLVDEELVTEVHRRGMKIVPWTLNEPEDMERITGYGVDGIITDYPNRAIELEIIRDRMGMD